MIPKKYIYELKSIIKPHGLEIVNYGSLNKNITFYLIRRLPPRAGFFSNFHHVLGHIMIAEEYGYIPIVDMENYSTFYDETSPVNGSNNAWEYYFHQINDYKLDEVYQSKKVVLSNGKFPFQHINVHFNYINNQKRIDLIHTLINKYIKYKPAVKAFIEKNQSSIFKDKKEILGVLSRGTDYKYAANHNRVPSANDLLLKTRELKNKWNINWVYLVTEEQQTMELFKSEFGKELLVSDSLRILNYREKSSVPQHSFNRKHDNYLKGLEYLSDIVLLSKCNSIICPPTNGSAAAIAMNGNKYENKYIFDLGINQ